MGNVIAEMGTMKSGKSKELINKISQYDGKKLILKPSTDTRDGAKVKSRAISLTYDAVLVDTQNQQIVNLVLNGLDNYDAVFIDEVQFFDAEFIETLLSICKSFDIDVVASGLMYDYKGQSFDSSKLLTKKANFYRYMTGECDCCGGIAKVDVLVNTWDNTLIEDGSSVLVEGSEDKFDYKTVCIPCRDTKFKRTTK